MAGLCGIPMPSSRSRGTCSAYFFDGQREPDAYGIQTCVPRLSLENRALTQKIQMHLDSVLELFPFKHSLMSVNAIILIKIF